MFSSKKAGQIFHAFDLDTELESSQGKTDTLWNKGNDTVDLLIYISRLCIIYHMKILSLKKTWNYKRLFSRKYGDQAVFHKLIYSCSLIATKSFNKLCTRPVLTARTWNQPKYNPITRKCDILISFPADIFQQAEVTSSTPVFYLRNLQQKCFS